MTSTDHNNETFANRVARYMDKFPNGIAAASAIHKDAKPLEEAFKQFGVSHEAEDADLARNLSDDLLVLEPHLAAVKHDFEMISEKSILKKVGTGALTDTDINRLRRKDVLGAMYCVLCMRKNEALEDYMVRVQRNKMDREAKEMEEFLKNEAAARKQAEEEKARSMGLEKVAFFLDTDNFEEALVQKTEELILSDEINNQSDGRNVLTNIVDSIKCVETGRFRLKKMFPDLENTEEIVAMLIELYNRASTTTLD